MREKWNFRKNKQYHQRLFVKHSRKPSRIAQNKHLVIVSQFAIAEPHDYFISDELIQCKQSFIFAI